MDGGVELLEELAIGGVKVSVMSTKHLEMNVRLTRSARKYQLI
jgi:hypothetical protein